MPNTHNVEVAHDSHYAFERGFPTDDTVTRAYDDADRDCAIQAYKFFYPTVSGAAIVRGNEQIGIVPNKVFGILDCGPQQLVFTANSDTPTEGGAALAFELRHASGNSVEVHFGPTAPRREEGRWIKTIPGKGWFAYFRIYGPEGAAFDETWKPGDFERIG